MKWSRATSSTSVRDRIAAMTRETEIYRPKQHVRIVTAGSLFDGHDAAINIMRRLLQASGAEVIHLGHNRSAAEIAECAIEEDVQGVAITSYQGGHLEFFKYLHDLLEKAGANIRIYGGGGGTILPDEIEELQTYGIDRIFSPDDGRSLGLQGMINEVLEGCDFPTVVPPIDGYLGGLRGRDPKAVGQMISLAENYPELSPEIDEGLQALNMDSLHASSRNHGNRGVGQVFSGR